MMLLDLFGPVPSLRCHHCGRVFPEDAFYVNNRDGRGRLTECRPCYRRRREVEAVEGTSEGYTPRASSSPRKPRGEDGASGKGGRNLTAGGAGSLFVGSDSSQL